MYGRDAVSQIITWYDGGKAVIRDVGRVLSATRTGSWIGSQNWCRPTRV